MSKHAPCVVCWNSLCALPHHLWAVGSGNPLVHCLTACRQWAVDSPPLTTSLLMGSGQQNSFCALPRCLWAVWYGVVCQRQCYQKAMAGTSTHGHR